jgi:hypothetical protein
MCITFDADALPNPGPPPFEDKATDGFSSLSRITVDAPPVGMDMHILSPCFLLAKQIFHALSIKWIIAREQLIFRPVKLVGIAWRHFNLLLLLPSQNSSYSSISRWTHFVFPLMVLFISFGCSNFLSSFAVKSLQFPAVLLTYSSFVWNGLSFQFLMYFLWGSAFMNITFLIWFG